MALKGHPNYNTSKDPLKNGGAFGHYGRHEGTYTDEDLEEMGKGLVEWIQQKGNIYCKYYFSTKGLLWHMVHKLGARSPMFKNYLDLAKEIQEAKLVSEPFHKKADGNHARFILARHHKAEWEDKMIVADIQQIEKLDSCMDVLTYLQLKEKVVIDNNQAS